MPYVKQLERIRKFYVIKRFYRLWCHGNVPSKTVSWYTAFFTENVPLSYTLDLLLKMSSPSHS